MIDRVMRMLDNLTGRGEAAVTVPPLDGAFRSNRALDEATQRMPLAGVDCLALSGGALIASAGPQLFALEDEDWHARRGFDADIACIAAAGDGLAVALVTGEVLIDGGRFAGPLLGPDDRRRAITAMAASDTSLFIAVGSTRTTGEAWQQDLLDRNADGEIWRIALSGGAPTRIAAGLGWPAGLALDGDAVVASEAWRHRLIRIDPARPGAPEVLHADLPGYPGRLSPAPGGHWLAVFAPRSQLVEFVQREPAYRRRMIAEVPRPYWIAPCLRAGRSFYEPLQGGGVKQLGMLKPWAPTMSSGLCVRLDAAFQPIASLHSRADGATHGVTSVLEWGGRVHAAAKGDDVVVAIKAANAEDSQ